MFTVNRTVVRTEIMLYHHKFIANHRVYFITLILYVLTMMVVVYYGSTVALLCMKRHLKWCTQVLHGRGKTSHTFI